MIKLGKTLQKIREKIAKAIFLDKKIINEVTEELKYSLIEADVDIQLVNEIIEKIKEEAYKEKLKDVEKKELILKLIHDEILRIIGKGGELKIEKGKNKKIMFIGLYGCGKTTTIAKIANYYVKRGYNVCMIGLDVHRPAAPEQLKQLAEKIKVPCFISKEEKDPLEIWKNFKKEIEKYDLCLIDTAGRHSLDKELIKEIKKLERIIQPNYTFLVISADIGQAAKKQVEEFRKSCTISGIIITRMDSSAKGGGALTACYLTNSPIYFIGTGEHLVDIETFSPENFVSRLLGMGDLKALVEKIESISGEKKVEKLNLVEFYNQLKNMQQAGPLTKLAEMIPGVSLLKEKLKDDLFEEQEEKIKKWKYAIDSMTKEELENPELLEKETTRITRIAKGSGVTTSIVREILNQYKLLKNFEKADSLDITSLQQGKIPAGLSRKQLMRLAKKYRKKIF